MKLPFDVMGFQECENVTLVLGFGGLLEEYTAFSGPHAMCMAFRTSTWKLMAKGESDVAEDMRTEHYGTRGAQWMRLIHKKTGKGMFFVNHHGPLHVNSGGLCGGKATAANLLKLMAANAKEGDALILVGDFNANAASLTLQTLWHKLSLIYNSRSFGGVDNILSNIKPESIVATRDLGSGGSDHHAISATISMGSGSLRQRATFGQGAEFSLHALKDARGDGACLMEPETGYVFSRGGWSKTSRSSSPKACCVACSMRRGCKAWSWIEYSEKTQAAQCTIKLGHVQVLQKVAKDGTTAGLPQALAYRAAARAAATALG